MSALSPRRAAHDPAFSDADRRFFMARVGALGFRYDTLAAELEKSNLPRPTVGNAAYRSLILATLTAHYGADAWMVADAVGRLYVPAAHRAAPLPVDDAGYVAALVSVPCGNGRRHGHTASLDTVARSEVCARIGLWIGMGRTPKLEDACSPLESE